MLIDRTPMISSHQVSRLTIGIFSCYSCLC